MNASKRRKASRLVPVLLDWFARHARHLPWRRTRDPYAIWVSEIMLQQTQVATVIPYFERWMKHLPDVRSLARASSQRLHKLWEGLGYYTRVRNMQRAAKVICKQHQGRFPDQFDQVLALPGIGRYTAGAICSIAFNRPTPVLDGNVIRVLTRVFGIVTDPKQQDTNAHLWCLAEALVKRAANLNRTSEFGLRTSPASCSALNQALMELGATICTPRNPRCPACPIRRCCVARREGFIHVLPALGGRPKITRKRVLVFAVEHGNRVWLVRRPSKDAGNGLWEFPSVETPDGRARPNGVARRILPFRSRDLVPLTTFNHNITRYVITFAAYTGRTDEVPAGSKATGRWATLAQLQALPLPAAHRRIADAICLRPEPCAGIRPADMSDLSRP